MGPRGPGGPGGLGGSQGCPGGPRAGRPRGPWLCLLRGPGSPGPKAYGLGQGVGHGQGLGPEGSRHGLGPYLCPACRSLIRGAPEHARPCSGGTRERPQGSGPQKAFLNAQKGSTELPPGAPGIQGIP
jgi:hypothetical protein